MQLRTPVTTSGIAGEGRVWARATALTKHHAPNISLGCESAFSRQKRTYAAAMQKRALRDSGLRATPDGSTSGASVSVSTSQQPSIAIVTELPPLELEHRRDLCDSGLPDVDECIIPEPPPAYDVMSEALSRGRWLLGLLMFQSMSSFVLDQYQDLLRDHIVVTLFLTMLVGAGGNAGNQSAIKVIRALATGSISVSWPSVRGMMAEQSGVALLLGGGLALGGFTRVYATNGNLTDAFAISISLFMIVMASVMLGTGLPFALAKAGIDPANAGTSIQVVMDILGVAITCVTCQLVLVQLAQSLA